MAACLFSPSCFKELEREVKHKKDYTFVLLGKKVVL